ncbi:hypothetical protein ACB285_15470 [Klebsiella quasipneumoniae]
MPGQVGGSKKERPQDGAVALWLAQKTELLFLLFIIVIKSQA